MTTSDAPIAQVLAQLADNPATPLAPTTLSRLPLPILLARRTVLIDRLQGDGPTGTDAHSYWQTEHAIDQIERARFQTRPEQNTMAEQALASLEWVYEGAVTHSHGDVRFTRLRPGRFDGDAAVRTALIDGLIELADALIPPELQDRWARLQPLLDHTDELRSQ